MLWSALSLVVEYSGETTFGAKEFTWSTKAMMAAADDNAGLARPSAIVTT